MRRKQQLAIRAIREATRIRRQVGIPPGDTVCPVDIATKLSIRVQYMALPSLEGMYNAEAPATIILGSQRPPGRQRFTCAHELGHHVFQHGTRIDELRAENNSDEEYLADNFAAALLMPKSVVDAALARREWLRRRFTRQMIFHIAQDIGVGYTSLIDQLTIVLRYLSFAEAKEFKKKSPRALREEIAGFANNNLYLVDQHWGARPVDMEVDDILLAPPDMHQEPTSGPLEFVSEPKPHWRARQPGRARLELVSRSIEVRVSREEYVGNARFRHLEDIEDET